VEELVQVFLEESREILQQLEEDLLDMERNPGDSEIIKRIFRAAHTIKGSAGLSGLDAISGLAHHLEDVLDQVRTLGEPMSKDCFDTVFRSIDMLNRMVDMTAGNEEIPPDMAGDLVEQLSFFIIGKETEETAMVAACLEETILTGPDLLQVLSDIAPTRSVFRLTLNFKPDYMESGHDPLRFIEELRDKGELLEINVNFSRLPEWDEIDPYRLYLSWTMLLETKYDRKEIDDIFVFVLDDNDIKITDVTNEIEPSQTAGKLTGELLIEEAKVAPRQVEAVLEKQKQAREQEQVNTIRVDTRRLENVLNLVAEMVISQSRVKELVSKQSQVDVEVFNSFQEVDKIIRRLQEEVMKTSMVPVGPTFTRFQRMVRDTAAEKGKEIELVISGQETEVDKRVIEQIADPLKHMIRNSIDHGIEKPEDREALGKPRNGKIWLRACHQEGSIVIEVRDDGRGLDPDKIYRKALSKGLVEENQKLSDHDMQRLIMMPGFSTADKISDISGRGVGLDVVATNIQALRGSIEVESTKGQGTRLIIRLPLTMAIIDGMMVTVGDEKYIIPLTSIVEFIKATPKDIKTVEGTGRVVNMRNEYIPLAALYRLLGIPAYEQELTDGLLVIIKDGRKKMALLVDDILGQEQVVTKSLKENFRQVDGVAGATILGDGRVAAILDVPTLIKMATR